MDPEHCTQKGSVRLDTRNCLWPLYTLLFLEMTVHPNSFAARRFFIERGQRSLRGAAASGRVVAAGTHARPRRRADLLYGDFTERFRR